MCWWLSRFSQAQKFAAHSHTQATRCVCMYVFCCIITGYCALKLRRPYAQNACCVNQIQQTQSLRAHKKPTDFRPLTIDRQTNWRLATQKCLNKKCISGFLGLKSKTQVEQTAGRGRLWARGAAEKPHAEFYALGKRFRFRCPQSSVFCLLSSAPSSFASRFCASYS